MTVSQPNLEPKSANSLDLSLSLVHNTELKLKTMSGYQKEQRRKQLLNVHGISAWMLTHDAINFHIKLDSDIQRGMTSTM